MRDSGFRPSLAQISMQISLQGSLERVCWALWRLRLLKLRADPPRWFSHVLIRAYRSEGPSGAGTDETTLGKITRGAKPGGHLPSRDYYTPPSIIFCNFLALAPSPTKKPGARIRSLSRFASIRLRGENKMQIDSPSGRNRNAFHDTIKGYDFDK
jgi:hypothetical protein